MIYTPQQRKAAADANAVTLVYILGAAQLRYLHPTLSYRESLTVIHKMSLNERLSLLLAVGKGFCLPSYFCLTSVDTLPTLFQNGIITYLIASYKADVKWDYGRTCEVPISSDICAALARQRQAMNSEVVAR